jgi:hypothetical protein
MSKLKKKIPLLALEKIEPFLSKESNFFRLDSPGDFLIKFNDKDKDSDYYFIIEQYRVESSNLLLLINYKPRSKESVESHRTWINGVGLDQSFGDWVKLLERYDKIKTIYDDPIEKKYKDEFYAEFEIVDDDADITSFNINQQLWLDSYLEKIIYLLDSHNGTNPELSELKEQVFELKDNLTNLTKKKIIEKLSWIWAKARKIGLPILKEIYVQVRNEIIKQLVEGNIKIIMEANGS